MSRLCECHHACRHLVRGTAAELLPPERLVELSAVLGTLVDAADAFDNDGLQIDPECGIHGERAISNAECICIGERFTAAEFVQALQVEVRSRGRFEPGHRPRRMKDGSMSLAIAG
jgi:hypothetical protein